MSVYRDTEKIVTYLESWIGARFAESGAGGAVLGISGGIDSAVLAGLLCRTIGADNVTGVIMPCHSMSVDEEYARLLVPAFGLNVVKVDLSAAYDALVAALGETGERFDGLPASNIKPRLRMTTLYAVAQRLGALVCGGSNRDEIAYGYFTKHGDSGVDLMPMADLLKGEVVNAAKFLGVPKEIIDRPPTAGLWAGQTDEGEMGLTYNELDRYLATGEGSDEVKAKIKAANTRSAHKRRFPLMAELPKDI